MSEIKPRIVDAPTDTMASYGQSFLEAMAKLRVDNEQLRAALAASQAEVERLRKLVARAAPMAWVSDCDMDGACEWEREASVLVYPQRALLDGVEETKGRE